MPILFILLYSYSINKKNSKFKNEVIELNKLCLKVSKKEFLDRVDEVAKYNSTRKKSDGIIVISNYELNDMDLTGVNFIGLIMDNLIFKNCILKEADFGVTILSNIDFSDSNLDNVTFIYSEMKNIIMKNLKSYNQISFDSCLVTNLVANKSIRNRITKHGILNNGIDE